MVAPIKEDKVQVFKDKLDNKAALFLADFQGITVNDLRKIRVDLRNNKSSFEVVKNRLFKLAIKDKVGEYPEEIFRGNTAIILCEEEIVSTAKILKDYAKSLKQFTIKGGFLDNKFLSKDKVIELATLPPKPEMVGQFLGMLTSPLRRLVFTLNSSLQNFTVVVSQIAKQKESENQ